MVEYSQGIYLECRRQEGTYCISGEYMERKQKDVNGKMRSILVDWMVDVSVKFKLKEESVFLMVNILDRYLQAVEVSRAELQLVGVASMFLACKYEEIYAPELKDFVYVTDNAYSKSQVLAMECQILHTLAFQLNFTSALAFFHRLNQLQATHDKQHALIKYILHLSLLHLHLYQYSQSLIAAAALYLVNKLFKLNTPWSSLL